VAIHYARPGDVLVVSAGEMGQAGTFGDVLGNAAKAKGIAAVVTDSGVRDTVHLRALGLPVFSTSISITGTVKETLGPINQPLVIGGQLVRPGDAVVGDADGVVVVEQHEVERVTELSQRREENERELIERYKAGASTIELCGLTDVLPAKGLTTDLDAVDPHQGLGGTMTDSTFTPSARVRRIRQSPSTAAAARVRELKSEGRTIHDLTVGEPDFDTPDHIKAAAIRAIEAGETKYTSVNGTPQLREAIRGHLLTNTGHGYGDSEIPVGGGGKQVIFLAFMASLDPGDEVIIPAPYWVSYPDMVRANDGEPVVVATSRSDGYKLTPQLLESAITEKTRWVVLNTPSNPAGVVYSASELEALGEVLARHPRVWVLTDEIYDEIHYGTEPPANFARVLPRFRDRHLLVNGVSKSYAMTG